MSILGAQLEYCIQH